MPGAPGLLAAGERDGGTVAVDVAIDGEEEAEALSKVHEVVGGHEADDGVRPDLAEGPGLGGDGAREDIVLRVVEDVGSIGLRDAGAGFFVGWMVGYVAVEFGAIGLESVGYVVIVCWGVE